MPSRRRLRSVSRNALALFWLATGCVQAPPVTPAAPTPSAAAPAPAPEEEGDLKIVLDREQTRAQPLAAWMVYGVAKLAAIQKAPGRGDDYLAEVAGRSLLVEFWEQRESKDREPDAYIDALTAVKRAGQLEEYVVAALSQPGWTIPGDVLRQLDLAGFATWSRANLGGHSVETHARIAREGASVAPPVPGADLPSFEELTQNGSALCEALPRASSAYAAWRAEEAKLPGVPLIGRSRAEFLAALEALRTSGSNAGRDVIWVSEKAADVSFLVGFCETDRNQRVAAVEPLETAVRLNPLSPSWRLELVGALTAAKRFDDSRREIQAAIALSDDDKCLLGSAWRKKGFLEIETGELEQADLSYRKSLEYEPGNELALRELAIILKQRMKQGDAGAKPYTPPPSLAPVKNTCRGG